MHGQERKGEKNEGFSKSGKTEKTDFAFNSKLGSEEEDKEKIENQRNLSPTSTVNTHSDVVLVPSDNRQKLRWHIWGTQEYIRVIQMNNNRRQRE